MRSDTSLDFVGLSNIIGTNSEGLILGVKLSGVTADARNGNGAPPCALSHSLHFSSFIHISIQRKVMMRGKERHTLSRYVIWSCDYSVLSSAPHKIYISNFPHLLTHICVIFKLRGFKTNEWVESHARCAILVVLRVCGRRWDLEGERRVC